MKLNQKLEQLKNENLKHIPADIAEVILKDVEIQVKKGITKNALKTGDKIPDFELRNAVGELVHSTDLLENGPLILSFYRGAWCPYCNVELSSYQEAHPDIKAEGAQLVAISPELPDTSMSLVDKHSLDFEILSDLNNTIAKQFGIVFQLSDELNATYKKMGLDLETSQGNANYELPFAATYVINSDGTVLEAAVNYDYTVRLDPQDAIEVIRTCAY